MGGRVFFCALITTAHPAPAPYLWLPVAKVPFCDASSEGHKLGINAAQVKNLNAAATMKNTMEVSQILNLN